MTTQQIREKISQGFPFTISFENKSLKIGKRTVNLDDAETTEELTTQEIVSRIESLYQTFKHSVPSELSNSNVSKYFYPLRLEELDTDDLLQGTDRHMARFDLEFFILTCLRKGHLTWQKDIFGEGWFWKSPNDKDLIILKSWFPEAETL